MFAGSNKKTSLSNFRKSKFSASTTNLEFHKKNKSEFEYTRKSRMHSP